MSKVLTANGVRLLSQEEELNVKPERLLRMGWVLTWKYTEGGDRKAGSLLVSSAPLHVCSSRGTEFASSAQATRPRRVGMSFQPHCTGNEAERIRDTFFPAS